jgi:hypothetical protein
MLTWSFVDPDPKATSRRDGLLMWNSKTPSDGEVASAAANVRVKANDTSGHGTG